MDIGQAESGPYTFILLAYNYWGSVCFKNMWLPQLVRLTMGCETMALAQHKQGWCEKKLQQRKNRKNRELGKRESMEGPVEM